MQQVNLVDPALLPPPLVLSGARLAAVAVTAAIVLALHLGHVQRQMAQTLASAGAAPEEMVGADAAVPGADADAAEDARLEAAIRQRRALRELLVRADDRPADAGAMLRDVIAALPDTVWLTAVDHRGRLGLRLEGGTLDPVALRGFAERLGRIDALRGVPVQTVRLEPITPDATDSPAPPRSHAFVLATAAYLAEGDTP